MRMSLGLYAMARECTFGNGGKLCLKRGRNGWPRASSKTEMTKIVRVVLVEDDAEKGLDELCKALNYPDFGWRGKRDIYESQGQK